MYKTEKNNYSFLIRISKNGHLVENAGAFIMRDGSQIFIRHAGRKHCLISLESSIRIYSLPANIIQIYARVIKGELCISNNPARLVITGEELEIKAQALIQHLAGNNYPENNYFYSMTELEASCEYGFKNGALKKIGSVLKNKPFSEPKDFIKPLLSTYRSYSDHVSILLSAGYDSRLNLAAALQAGKKITAYHEYVSDYDLEIVKNLADVAGVDLNIMRRSDIAADISTLSRSKEFIDLCNMGYRTSLAKWSVYCKNIRDSHPDRDLIGLGVETHKGFYYDMVKDIRKDLRPLMYRSHDKGKGYDKIIGCIDYYDFASEKFEGLLCEAESIYPDSIYSRIDFMFYHENICNGFGGRNHLMYRLCDTRFPNLEDELFSSIFSMEAAYKKSGMLVKIAIEQFAPELFQIPVSSTNAFALSERSLGQMVRDAVKPWKKKWQGKKNPKILHFDDFPKPETELTRRIYGDMQGENKLHSAKRVYRYLSYLEMTKNVGFRLL